MPRLHHAAAECSTAMVRTLLAEKASVNARQDENDPYSDTPLSLAILCFDQAKQKDRLAVIDLLLEAKADVNLRYTAGLYTALMLEVQEETYSTQPIKMLLDKKADANAVTSPADPNEKAQGIDGQMSALQFAVADSKFNAEKLVAALLTQPDIQVNIKDESNSNPLKEAFNLIVYLKRYQENSPSYLYKYKSLLKCISLLIDAKADLKESGIQTNILNSVLSNVSADNFLIPSLKFEARNSDLILETHLSRYKDYAEAVKLMYTHFMSKAQAIDSENSIFPLYFAIYMFLCQQEKTCGHIINMSKAPQHYKNLKHKNEAELKYHADIRKVIDKITMMKDIFPSHNANENLEIQNSSRDKFIAWVSHGEGQTYKSYLENCDNKLKALLGFSGEKEYQEYMDKGNFLDYFKLRPDIAAFFLDELLPENSMLEQIHQKFTARNSISSVLWNMTMIKKTVILFFTIPSATTTITENDKKFAEWIAEHPSYLDYRNTCQAELEKLLKKHGCVSAYVEVLNNNRLDWWKPWQVFFDKYPEIDQFFHQHVINDFRTFTYMHNSFLEFCNPSQFKLSDWGILHEKLRAAPKIQVDPTQMIQEKIFLRMTDSKYYEVTAAEYQEAVTALHIKMTSREIEKDEWPSEPKKDSLNKIICFISEKRALTRENELRNPYMVALRNREKELSPTHRVSF